MSKHIEVLDSILVTAWWDNNKTKICTVSEVHPSINGCPESYSVVDYSLPIGMRYREIKNNQALALFTTCDNRARAK
jgi:hypothetical protein